MKSEKKQNNRLKSIITVFLRAIGEIIIFFIRGYQRFISPFLGSNCRFFPSCSEYAVISIRKYGLFLGAFKALGRILRCNPLFKGGVDEP